MAEKNMSDRDMTLVNILERLSNQIKQNNIRLEEIEKSQFKLASSVDNIRHRQNLRQDETGGAVEKFEQTLTRYRSDMLSLVNEQDRIGANVKELASKQVALFDAQENIAQNLEELKERYAIQEKIEHDHSVYAIEQKETLSKEWLEFRGNVIQLHMDTEKHFLAQYQEIQRQMQELRIEIMRRLLAFDGVESALNTLLLRTEPPPPKELPKFIRPFYNAFVTVRSKLSLLLRRVSGWLRKRFGKVE